MSVHQPLSKSEFFKGLSASALWWTEFAQSGGGNRTPKNLIVERHQAIPHKRVGQRVEIYQRPFSQPDRIHGQEMRDTIPSLLAYPDSQGLSVSRN
jgi:hypothetical protein